MTWCFKHYNETMLKFEAGDIRKRLVSIFMNFRFPIYFQQAINQWKPRVSSIVTCFVTSCVLNNKYIAWNGSQTLE